YAWADESDKLRTDYQEGFKTLKLFLDATNEKMTAPVQEMEKNITGFYHRGPGEGQSHLWILGLPNQMPDRELLLTRSMGARAWTLLCSPAITSSVTSSTFSALMNTYTWARYRVYRGPPLSPTKSATK
ncbi:hypothetical protein NHX12_000215, partial [Muraenolepis orangiensis]